MNQQKTHQTNDENGDETTGSDGDESDNESEHSRMRIAGEED